MDIDVKTFPIKVIRQRMVFAELQPPEETTMLLGEKIDSYIQMFGSLPLSIRTVLQNLLTRGKIVIQFDDGSNERIELADKASVMSQMEAVKAMNVYEEVPEPTTMLGKPITQRVVVAASKGAHSKKR